MSATHQTATDVALMQINKVALAMLVGLAFLAIIKSQVIRSYTPVEPVQEPLPAEQVNNTKTTKNTTQKLSEPQKDYTYSYANWREYCSKISKLAKVPLNEAAYKLIEKESHCHPAVMNAQGSSAGGIPQALPWTKMGCKLEVTNKAAVCQLKWMENYVVNRYSSWEAALAFHIKNGWY